jgi:hypothetical protein
MATGPTAQVIQTHLVSFEEIHNDVSVHASGKVVYFQFPRLAREPGLVHAVFTRHGGVSSPPFSSLNTSYSTGDDPEHVRQNLSIIRQVMGGEDVLFLDQVHGREILILRQGDSPEFPQGAQADAVITNRKNLVVMVKQADCQGVILYDPGTRVLGIAHCGWRGNTLNILGAVVERMVSQFGCSRPRMIAALAPSLGPCCAEFNTYRDIFPESFTPFMVRENYFDLWEISRRQLIEAGLSGEKIELARVCTSCRTDLFFSYRAEKTTGRFATAALLI